MFSRRLPWQAAEDNGLKKIKNPVRRWKFRYICSLIISVLLFIALCAAAARLFSGLEKPDISEVVHHAGRNIVLPEEKTQQQAEISAQNYCWYDSTEQALTDTSLLRNSPDMELAEDCFSSQHPFAGLETQEELALLYCQQDLLLSVKLKKNKGSFSQPFAVYARGISLSQMPYHYDPDDIVCEYICREYLTGMYIEGGEGDIYYGLLPVSADMAVSKEREGHISGTLLGKDIYSDRELETENGKYLFWQSVQPALTQQLSDILLRDYTYKEMIRTLSLEIL